MLLLLSTCEWFHASTVFGSGAIVFSRRKDIPTACPLYIHNFFFTPYRASEYNLTHVMQDQYQFLVIFFLILIFVEKKGEKFNF